MSIFRKFRVKPRTNKSFEAAEVDRILRRGPLDKPAGIKHNHTLARSLNGWW